MSTTRDAASAIASPPDVRKQAHEEPEKRVQQRTAELQKANEELRNEIAECRKTAEALGEIAQRFQSILESSPFSVFIKDLQGRYLYVTLQFASLSDLRREQIVGKTDDELFPPEQAAAFRANDLKVFESGAAGEFEEVATRRDGLYVSLVTKFPLRDTKANVYGLCGVATDITERKRAAEALGRVNQRLSEQARLLDLAHDAIIVRDPMNSITFWSSGAQETYGWTKEEVVGKITGTLLDIESPLFEEVERKLFDEGSWEGELSHIRRDGKRITVASRQAVQLDDRGRPVAILEINRDITERKVAEKSLQEVSSRLLAVQDEERRRLARELHDGTAQTLAALSLNLALLEQRACPALDERAASALRESVDLASQASRELRTFSYLLHPPLLDEVGLAQAVKWYAEGFTQRTKIEVDLRVLPAEFGRLPQDLETALFRIIQESLTNIYRHSGSSTADVWLNQSSRGVTLQVRDRGKGLLIGSLEWQDQSPNAMGVGIRGMRERVRQLGGQVTFRPANPGTQIEITLPLKTNS